MLLLSLVAVQDTRMMRSIRDLLELGIVALSWSMVILMGEIHLIH